MKSTVKIVCIILTMIFYECASPDPIKDDIVGRWVSSDGAVLELNKDGSFSGRSLPGEKIFFPSIEFMNKRFEGNGYWELRKGQNRWEISLEFKHISGRERGYSTQILMSREGAWENGDIWYLFEWVSEEGGERYRFDKDKIE